MLRQASRLLGRSITQQLKMTTIISRGLSTSGATTPKMSVSFISPYGFYTREVDMVSIPSTTGQMGILPGHVPTTAELQPGILSMHDGNDVARFFISSGFASINENSVADIVAVEAAPVEQIDQSLVQKGLAEFTQKLRSATTDSEKAEAQLGVDVYNAFNSALKG